MSKGLEFAPGYPLKNFTWLFIEKNSYAMIFVPNIVASLLHICCIIYVFASFAAHCINPFFPCEEKVDKTKSPFPSLGFISPRRRLITTNPR